MTPFQATCVTHQLNNIAIISHSLSALRSEGMWNFSQSLSLLILCRSGWTTSQNKLFNRVYKVLISSRLARLANSGCQGEPVQRRLYADKCAKRIRSIFSGVFWVSVIQHEYYHDALHYVIYTYLSMLFAVSCINHFNFKLLQMQGLFYFLFFKDEDLLSWLHTTCMTNISATLLSDYLEVLQTLKSKVPLPYTQKYTSALIFIIFASWSSLF